MDWIWGRSQGRTARRKTLTVTFTVDVMSKQAAAPLRGQKPARLSVPAGRQPGSQAPGRDGRKPGCILGLLGLHDCEWWEAVRGTEGTVCVAVEAGRAAWMDGVLCGSFSYLSQQPGP